MALQVYRKMTAVLGMPAVNGKMLERQLELEVLLTWYLFIAKCRLYEDCRAKRELLETAAQGHNAFGVFIHKNVAMLDL